MNAKAAIKHHVMQAVTKPKSGKGSARELRRQGYVPAVIYGLKQDPQTIAINAKDLSKALRVGHFFTHTQEINLDGKTTKLLARDIQRDPVTETPIHIDFLRFDASSKVHVNVTVVITGQNDCPGLKTGGVLQLVESTLELVCRADSIPQEIEVSVAGLEIGDSIHLSSIKLPQDVRSAVTDRDLTIASIIATRTSTMAELDAAAEAGAAPVAAEVPAMAQKAPDAAAAPAKDAGKDAKKK